MPFILRIILQRILLFIYSVLTFLGIAPQAQIATPEEVAIIQEQRRERISDILSERPSQTQIAEIEKRDLENPSTMDVLEKTNPELPVTPITKSPTPTIAPTPTVTPTTQPSTQIPITPTQATTPTSPTPATPKIIPESPILQPQSIQQKNISVEDVLVNTVCVERSGNSISVTTGSGVIISPQGVILTNAHVAQFFILQDYNKSVDCAVYKENIPTYGYKAEILYISKEWINRNYNLIREKTARGTGEYDYALLYITKNTNPTISIPQSFPSARLALSQSPNVGYEVLVAGYPGGPTSILDLTRSVKLRTAFVNILDIFTFGGNNPDIFTVSRSEVGAKGASGGGVFLSKNDNLDLLGVIVTTDGTGGNAKINAITTNYINRAIQSETGNNLNYYLSGNLKSKSEQFSSVHLKDLASLLIK